jgi:hypothetical protein
MRLSQDNPEERRIALSRVPQPAWARILPQQLGSSSEATRVLFTAQVWPFYGIPA